ncbi:MAG: hypothetical protein ACKVQS_12040 [Fimbriimonadaceae bacterium]
MSLALKIITIICAIAVIALVLWPVTGHKPTSPKTQLISNMHQIGTSIAIYVSDYDGQIPPHINRSENVKVLEPYLKNRKLFDPVQKNFNLPVQFNANLAGVKIDDPKGIPLADKTNFLPPSQAVMLYAIITKKDESPAIFTYADTSTKALPKGSTLNPADIFAPQFDR